VRPASPSPRRTRTRSVPPTATAVPPAAKEKKTTRKATTAGPYAKVVGLKAAERVVQAKKDQAKK
jgi:hypothetical protein